MGAAFVYGFNSTSRKSKSNCLFKFRHVNALFLEIRIFANRPGGVKLGSAGSVGIASSHF